MGCFFSLLEIFMILPLTKKYFIFHTTSAASLLVPLSHAVVAKGHDVVTTPLPSSPFYTVVITSLNKQELASVRTIAAHPIVAAQISPHFPFIESLRQQAEEDLQMTVIAIPPLRLAEDFTVAATLIIAAADSMPPAADLTASIKTEPPTPPMLSLEQIKQAAQALISSDNTKAQEILAIVETVEFAALPPLVRVLRLRLQIQAANDDKKRLNLDEPHNIKQKNDDTRRAATLLEREIFNLSEKERTQSGAQEFVVALKARLALQDIF